MSKKGPVPDLDMQASAEDIACKAEQVSGVLQLKKLVDRSMELEHENSLLRAELDKLSLQAILLQKDNCSTLLAETGKPSSNVRSIRPK